MPAAALPGSLEGSPARVPSPGPSPEQRRFNLLILGLMVLLVAALAGGLALYTHIHDEHQAAARAKADVLQAYLNYYSALEQAYRELDPAPLRPFVTAPGMQQELPVLNKSIQAEIPLQVVAIHHPQVVVYRGGRLASVDDIIVRHITPIGLNPKAPNGPERTDIIHQSFALQKQNGRWLVSSALAFGFGAPEGNLGISYAADPHAQPLSGSIRSEIMKNYEAYWSVKLRDFTSSHISRLETVELAPELVTKSTLDPQTKRADDQ